jgi:two-component system, cell cycle response regulator
MKKSTILVVDDEIFFRRLYSEILCEDGEIETVASGEEASERLQRGGVDLVLTDMVMPGSDGMEVLRFARSLDNPPEVILVTGHATLETAIRALKNGARDYLIKPFDPDELRHVVRTCLEQRRVLDENSLLKSQIRLFQRGQSLASQLEIAQLLPLAVGTLLQETGTGRGFAFLADRNVVTRQLALKGLEDAQATGLSHSLLPHLQGLSGIRLLRRDQLNADPQWPEQVQTICLFPLHCRKKLRGAIVILNPVGSDLPHPLPSDNLLFLAEQAGLGFENAYRYEGARGLIYTDDLTGLYNHRYLQQALDQEIRRSERYGLGFSLVFIDLDYFKNINDTHGHLAGSKSLREVAGLLRQSVREVDMVFRYGGDEFTALLVETDSRGAAVVAERIRQAIESHTFLAGTEAASRLTATVGYSTFPENANDKKSIIELADQAMYYGKKDRNVARGAWELKKS